MTFERAIKELVDNCDNGDVDDNGQYQPCCECTLCRVRIAIEKEVERLETMNFDGRG